MRLLIQSGFINNPLFLVQEEVGMKLAGKYFELFLIFFKIGAFTFGGGYAMVPLIKNEIVDKRRWLSNEEFMDSLAIAQAMPGPIALNTSLFVGNKRLGFKGSLFSGLGIILPSFIVILLVAIVFAPFRDHETVEKIFKGIRPAVVALIAAPLLGMGKAAGVRLKNLWIPVVVALLVGYFGISPVFIVVAAILLGVAKLLVTNNRFNRKKRWN